MCTDYDQFVGESRTRKRSFDVGDLCATEVNFVAPSLNSYIAQALYDPPFRGQNGAQALPGVARTDLVGEVMHVPFQLVAQSNLPVAQRFKRTLVENPRRMVQTTRESKNQHGRGNEYPRSHVTISSIVSGKEWAPLRPHT